ncbi:MAG: hypothetical protein ACOYT8_03655 [Candidatus Dependentiae bacterium]
MFFLALFLISLFSSQLSAMDNLLTDKQELYPQWFERLKTQQAHKAARQLQQSLVVDRHIVASAYASGQIRDELLCEDDRDCAEMLVAGNGLIAEQSCTIL